MFMKLKERFFPIITLLSCVLAFSSHTATWAANSDDFLFGVETHFRRLEWGNQYGVPGKSSQESYDVLMRFVDDLGVNMIRDGSQFDAIMPEAGVFHFNAMDKLMTDLQSRGITLNHVVTTTPNWAADKGFDNSWRMPPTIAAWGSLTQALAQRYAGHDNYLIEVYNEPNLAQFWSGSPQKYFETLEATNPLLKGSTMNGGLVLDQNAPVYVTGIAQMLMNNDVKYFAFHAHDQLPGAIYLYERYLKEKIPLERTILNECGSSNLNDDEQARELPEKAIWAFAQGFKGFSAYYLGCVSRSANMDLNENNPNKDYSLVGDDLVPRKAYHSYKTVISMLKGSSLVEKEFDAEGRGFVLAAKSSGRIYISLGATQNQTNIASKIGGNYAVFDMYGKPTDATGSSYIKYYVESNVSDSGSTSGGGGCNSGNFIFLALAIVLARIFSRRV
jgi:hypothetical protein